MQRVLRKLQSLLELTPGPKIPYMPQAQIDWLATTLTKEMKAFEWGSGGSTFFIASRVKSLVSIESGRRWYAKVLLRLILSSITNCRLKLVLPEPPPRQSVETELYRSTGKYGHLTYKKYVEAIDFFPDDYFDFVLIDGRCRAQCLLRTQTKVKKGGYILLDDADRSHYVDAISSLENFSNEFFERSIVFRRLP